MKLPHGSAVVVLAFGFALAHCTTASTGDPGTGDPSSSAGSSNSGTASGSDADGSSGTTYQGDDASIGPSSGAGSSGSVPSSGSTSPSSGAESAGGSGEGGGSACPANDSTQKTFVNLAVPMLSALSASENDAIPTDAGAPLAVPQGWSYYAISGAMCRDGSPAGIYVHRGTANKLFIYLEGGGACSSPTFCSHNPAAVSQAFPGGAQTQGQTIGGSLGSVTGGPYQAPYVPTAASGLTAAYSPGIFDFTNTANPVKDWSGVYVPYCTGDVHFGTADNVTIPGDGLLPDADRTSTSSDTGTCRSSSATSCRRSRT